MNSSLESWLASPVYIGRDKELDLMRRALLGASPKTVSIVGVAGVGKTSLAMAFSHMFSDAFPAGTYHVHASPFRRLSETIDISVSHPSKPYLLILDDTEVIQSSDLDPEIQRVRETRPSARIIAISRHVLRSPTVDVTLNLSGLSTHDLQELINRFVDTTGLDKGSIQRILQVVEGNPRIALHLLQELRATGRLPPNPLSLLRDFSYSGILGPDGKPISSGSTIQKQVAIDVISVSEELLRKIQKNPSLMRELSDRKFEEFVAEILSRLGYEITLTPVSRDGGKDIYAAKKDHVGHFLYLVECKKYAPNNPVGVGVIRQLHGVVSAEGATAGIVATTSFFTRDAKEFQEKVKNQMSLKDFLALQDWLTAAFGR